MACVDTDICDPSCSTYLVGTAGDPAQPRNDSYGSGDAGGGPAIEDDPNDLCEDTCQFLFTSGCLTKQEQLACDQGCAIVSDAKRDEFTSCIADNGCHLSCFEDYIPLSDDDDDTVNANMNGGSFGGSGDSFAVSGCKDGCDHLNFFDCIGAVDHSACYDACEVVDTDDANWFESCAFGDICDPGCFEVLMSKASD